MFTRFAKLLACRLLCVVMWLSDMLLEVANILGHVPNLVNETCEINSCYDSKLSCPVCACEEENVWVIWSSSHKYAIWLVTQVCGWWKIFIWKNEIHCTHFQHVSTCFKPLPPPKSDLSRNGPTDFGFSVIVIFEYHEGEMGTA